MIEVIRLLGRDYKIACKSDAEAQDVRHLAISLEQRLKHFIIGDSSYQASHAHALVLVGLQLEKEVEILNARKVRESAGEQREEALQALLVDRTEELDTLRVRNEKRIKKDLERIGMIKELESKIDGVLEILSSDS